MPWWGWLLLGWFAWPVALCLGIKLLCFMLKDEKWPLL